MYAKNSVNDIEPLADGRKGPTKLFLSALLPRRFCDISSLDFPKFSYVRNVREVKQKQMGQNGPRKICGRQLLKNLKWYGLPQQTISLHQFKFFKGCLPKILLGPSLNTLLQINFFLVLKIPNLSNLTSKKNEAYEL